MDLKDVQRRAAEDAEFRAALIADPRAALASCGIEIPADMKCEIVRMSEDEMHEHALSTALDD